MFPGIQPKVPFELLNQTEPIADQERRDVDDPFLKFFLREKRIHNHVQVSLERLAAPRFGIYKFRSQCFHLMKHFLPGIIECSGESRIHSVQGRPERFQLTTQSIADEIEHFYALDACNRFSADKITAAMRLERQ